MKTGCKIIFPLLILINSSFLFSQKLSVQDRDILKLQDERTLGGDDILINYLQSPENEIRFRALYALANIADSNTVNMTAGFLPELSKENNIPELLNEYAFYLGQTPCMDSKIMLTNILNESSLNSDNKEIINSLGKTGDEKDMENLIRKSSGGDDFNEAFAMSLARFALRKIRNENSVDALKKLVNNSSDTVTKRNAAFAFWRTGDKNLLENSKQEIYNLTKSDDTQTRMWAYNAIGKLQDKMLLMLLLKSFNSEKDWRVKVNMLNSLTNFSIDSLTELTLQLYSVIGDAIDDENENVGFTAISVMGKLFSDVKNSNNTVAKSMSGNIKEEMIYGLDSVNDLSWRMKSELANSMSLIYKDEVRKELFKAFSKTNNYDLKAGILTAFGNFNDGMIYKEVRDTITAEIKKYNEKNPNTSGDLIGSNDLAKLYRGFVEMLSNLDEKVDAENKNITRLIFTEFAGSKDPVIVDICLNALKDSIYLKYKEETISVLMFDYNELEYPKDYDVNLIFIDAMKDLNNENTVKVLENNLKSGNYDIGKLSADVLEKITGKKYEFSAKPMNDFDWEYIENISQNKIVSIKTNKGEIKIELLPDIAPFTVMNFLKLSEKNFYDGTIFHRVVPNFVIQGGDPTGTGFGGPGYTIRSEFSPLTYETGMVGMASSGKDTEGSQFFITHSATPHLDGKYTIFGKVVEGMDVVDKIMIGDYIENISSR